MYLAAFRQGLNLDTTVPDEPIAVPMGADRPVKWIANHALGEKETGRRAALPIFREIMVHAYQRELVGPVPPFPREIEDRIDEYLARQAALKVSPLAPPPEVTPTQSSAGGQRVALSSSPRTACGQATQSASPPGCDQEPLLRRER